MESLYTNNYTDVVAKKKSLDQVASKLKEQFVGLDYIIDDVIKLVSAWYIFPKAQLRPCIINLWGLTGSGKTALIKSLIDLLDHRKYYAHFDMGEFQSENARWIKRTFNDDLAHFHNEQAIICLDEFQFARSIDDKGDESNNDKLRVIWELMDSGKLYYTSAVSQFYVGKAEMLISILTLFRLRGGEIKNGEASTEKDLFLQLFDSFYFDGHDRHDEKLSASYFKSKDFIQGMIALDDNTTPKDVMQKKICSFNIEELIRYVGELIKKAVIPTELNLQYSLIFVLGNLDEAIV